MDIKQIEKYGQLIKEYTLNNYKECFREPDGKLKYKFMVPGISYPNALWDWDSWLTDLALGKLPELGDITEYEKGCIYNFLEYVKEDGRMPIWIEPEGLIPAAQTYSSLSGLRLIILSAIISDQCIKSHSFQKLI